MQKKRASKSKAQSSAKTPQTFDEYMAAVPEPARTTLEKMRRTIRSVVPPETTEVLSYGIPTFKYEGALVAFAAFKNHCSFFPMSSSLLDKLGKDFDAYRTSKGTLQFPLDQPLPSPLLKKLVKLRIAENKARKAAK